LINFVEEDIVYKFITIFIIIKVLSKKGFNV